MILGLSLGSVFSDACLKGLSFGSEISVLSFVFIQSCINGLGNFQNSEYKGNYNNFTYDMCMICTILRKSLNVA